MSRNNSNVIAPTEIGVIQALTNAEMAQNLTKVAKIAGKNRCLILALDLPVKNENCFYIAV